MDLRAQPLADPPAENQDARPRQRPRISGSIQPVPASALVPGTDIPVVHGLLPPQPEGDDGGLLDELGQQQVPQEPPQIPRTGAASVGPGQLQVHQEPAQTRTGEGASLDRQNSRMSTEPEPHPTPALAPAQPHVPPVQGAQLQPAHDAPHVPPAQPSSNVFQDPNRLDGYVPVRSSNRSASSTEAPYFTEDFL